MAQAYDGAHVLGEIRGDDEAALRGFREALRWEPHFAAAWHNSGVSLLRLERYEEAADAFRRATYERPDLARAWSGLGLALAQLRRFEEAADAYAHGAAARPDDPALCADAALAAALAGRREAAEAWFARLDDLAPGWYALHSDHAAVRELVRAPIGTSAEIDGIELSDVSYCPPLAELRFVC
jgi:Flp pilus assembly protein TadD